MYPVAREILFTILLQEKYSAVDKSHPFFALTMLQCNWFAKSLICDAMFEKEKRIFKFFLNFSLESNFIMVL